VFHAAQAEDLSDCWLTQDGVVGNCAGPAVNQLAVGSPDSCGADATAAVALGQVLNGSS
jgi:hypothetical protein